MSLIEAGRPSFFITANTHYAMLTAERPELRPINDRAFVPSWPTVPRWFWAVPEARPEAASRAGGRLGPRLRPLRERRPPGPERLPARRSAEGVADEGGLCKLQVPAYHRASGSPGPPAVRPPARWPGPGCRRVIRRDPGDRARPPAGRLRPAQGRALAGRAPRRKLGVPACVHRSGRRSTSSPAGSAAGAPIADQKIGPRVGLPDLHRPGAARTPLRPGTRRSSSGTSAAS